jgi:hypothetical protein
LVALSEGTANQGSILKPSHSHCNLEYYVDANFAKHRTPKNSSEPTAVKTCTGFIISNASFPFLWSFKSQSEMHLSTTKVEYFVMSQAIFIASFT